MKRRDFLKYTGGGIAALVVGNGLPWVFDNAADAAVRVQTLNFTITDAIKEMVTHNIGTPSTPGSDGTCYFWIYKEASIPAECPGPIIFCKERELIRLTITNALDEDHAFFIPRMFNSGPIPPGATREFRFRAGRAGTYLYYDNLNEPVNRVMGLHGAFVVMPRRARPGHKFTPYSRPTRNVQKLYDDFGTGHWPGLAWEDGDPATDTPAFRQYVWLAHEASPVLFGEVGNFTPGLDYPATDFSNAFNHDPYADTFTTGVFNKKPHYFMLNGQSGHFVHNNPFTCPNNRVGEPVLIRVLNAGLQLHSMHIHANHVWVTCVNGAVQENPLWVDTYSLYPLDTFDYTVPYMRPPDVPNELGIGRADISPPLVCKANPLIPGSTPHPVWPPEEELATSIPGLIGANQAGIAGDVGLAQDGVTQIDLGVLLSPLCYPMHDHSEPSQTAMGGNYNCGLISGINFTGDRNTPGGVTTFPDAPTTHGPSETTIAAGPETGE